MKETFKRMSHEEFLKYIDDISNRLDKYIKENDIKIDYICPIIRSGQVPATYIANKLNIVKFAPMQVKHIKYKDGKETIENLFVPFDILNIEKDKPIFLIVEGNHSSGKSVKLCIDEIKKRYNNAKILYVCFAKKYNSISFKNIVDYEDFAFKIKLNNNLTKEECEKLNVQYENPLYPWEILEMEIEHPDDLEENIFF